MQHGHKSLPKTYAKKPIPLAKLPSQKAKPQTIPPRYTQAPQDVPSDEVTQVEMGEGGLKKVSME